MRFQPSVVPIAGLSLVVALLAVTLVSAKRLVQLKMELANLKTSHERTHGLAVQLETLGKHLATQASRAESFPCPPAEPQRWMDEAPRRLEAIRRLSQAEQQLSETTRLLERLQQDYQALRGNLAELVNQQEQWGRERKELEERLASSLRQIDALQLEIKASTNELSRLQSRNQLLGEETRKLRQQVEAWQRAATSLKELYFRQEEILNRLLRRYRELAEELRASGLEPRETEGTPSAEGVNWSRLRYTLSLAEDDLRQLETLNARLVKLQRALLENR